MRISNRMLVVNAISWGLMVQGCGAEWRRPTDNREMKMKDSQAETQMRHVHGAGRWYPGDSNALRRAVSEYMDRAVVPRVAGRIVAAIAPHAGYTYSGPVAGYTFRAIRDGFTEQTRPQTVVVLGFSHRGGFRGVALLDGTAIETPLGAITIDSTALGVLTQGRERVYCDHRPHDGEHSAENEIPFVQAALPGVPIVVALMGDHDEVTRREWGQALGALNKERRVLLVASSDMLHDANYDMVTRTDRESLALVRALARDKLAASWSGRKQTFCGICPVLSALEFAAKQGCREGTVLHYRNSGDDYPESRGQWVVGYGAVVFSVP